MTTRDVTTCKVLIVGGYGTFGGRLAQLLADEPRLTLVIAGRSRAKAEAFCAALDSVATTVAVAFDRDGDVVSQLQQIAPDVVVDATGPFQNYEGDAYRVVKAAIALGINYLDLADGTAFVRGITAFDDAARERGVFVLSGASTFPSLTAAVAMRIAADMAHVESIVGGIAPSPFAKVGPNAIHAIASYAGKPVALLRNGRRTTAVSLMDHRDVTIAPPGRLPLPRVRFSLIEAPDLDVLPSLWPGLRSVWVGAGLRPKVSHHVLTALAWAVRLKMLPSLSPLAGLMTRGTHLMRWGEHRGGMVVIVRGTTAAGAPVERSWHLVAEADDGPLIPSMAAAAIVRKVLARAAPVPGARTAAADMTLADYEAMFMHKRIVTGTREGFQPGEHVPLYRRILGDAYARMPEPLQAMHDVDGEHVATGVAMVERGRSLLSRFAAWLVGFPAAGENIPVTVVFRSRVGGEHWQRAFDRSTFGSLQEEGQGRNEHLLCERFGPLNLMMALVLDGERLRLVPRRWTLFGIPLPLSLGPRCEAYEYAEDGRFHFHVALSHLLTGPIVVYRGWLVRAKAPVAPATSAAQSL